MAWNWSVLYLRPRCEKKMAEYCRVNDITHYLPLRRESKIYQRRKVTVEKPIFPGYFFVTFDADERLCLLKSNNIVRILEPGNQRKFLHELAQIRKALKVDPSLGACVSLKAGRKVRIRGGPFMGIEGVIATLKGMGQVRLNVDLIGQAVVVEVDKQFIEVLPD